MIAMRRGSQNHSVSVLWMENGRNEVNPEMDEEDPVCFSDLLGVTNSLRCLLLAMNSNSNNSYELKKKLGEGYSHMSGVIT